MRGITNFGSDPVLVAFGLVFLWRMISTGRDREARLFIATSIASALLYQILNRAIHRPRPPMFFGLPTPGGFSFPSGHSVKSSTVYIAMAMLGSDRMLARACAVALAGTIGFSRIYLGMHYPSDVLGGFTIGALCLAVMYYRRMPV